MPLLRSPEGEEHDIPDAGVTALIRLSWEQVEKPRPERKSAPRRRTSKSED